ncbi:hypothetical protein GQ600_22255 [Phytophthora cactorum]|nr:hypothetical protein GQ600_22255 [Phytophthora cactorum]
MYWVEPDICDRLHLANETLRTAILGLLAPTAINGKVFGVEVLGLEFDTSAGQFNCTKQRLLKLFIECGIPKRRHVQPGWNSKNC